MRLIDADLFEVVTAEGVSEDFVEGMAYVLEKIDSAPTVEPPKGEWIEDTVCCENPFDPYKEDFMDVVICSKCGAYYGIEKRSNFCSHCGADMRKKV